MTTTDFFLAPNEKVAIQMCLPDKYGYKKIKFIDKVDETCVSVWAEIFYWTANQKKFINDVLSCGCKLTFIEMNGKMTPTANKVGNLKSNSKFKYEIKEGKAYAYAND
jgi:hypothetical protein